MQCRAQQAVGLLQEMWQQQCLAAVLLLAKDEALPASG